MYTKDILELTHLHSKVLRHIYNMYTENYYMHFGYSVHLRTGVHKNSVRYTCLIQREVQAAAQGQQPGGAVAQKTSPGSLARQPSLS